MPDVRYTPLDPSDDQECTVFGVTFPAEEWVGVDDDVAFRLGGNPTFETKPAPAGKAKPKE